MLMKLRPIAYLMLLALTSCATAPKIEPVPCPNFPQFREISEDSRQYILDVLNTDPGDSVLQSVLSDVLDTTGQNNITWLGYVERLEVRAGCSP